MGCKRLNEGSNPKKQIEKSENSFVFFFLLKKKKDENKLFFLNDKKEIQNLLSHVIDLCIRSGKAGQLCSLTLLKYQE